MAGTAKVRDTVYNLRIAKRNIRMSNLTPDDVDLRLTATKAELTEEDQRLWLGLEDEKISRIAGDEANKQFTELVKQQNSGTESRLSIEVIHRSEGDLSNLNSLNAVAQALSDYRIKTDLEINNEIIARKALGVELNTRVNNFVAAWDHQKFLIYQTIQEVQDDVDDKYQSMDSRIKKYEDMLQDITTDSIQITMDNGEINMGAWTILSQAREWDLEIIAEMKTFQVNINGSINEALEDFQKQMPVEENIINNALNAFSRSPIVSDLDDRISKGEGDVVDLHSKVDQNQQNTANEMIGLSDALNDKVKLEEDARKDSIQAEEQARIEAVQREADIRQQQLTDVNGDISAIGTVVNEMEIKLEEVDGKVSGVVSTMEGIQLTVKPIKASGTWKVSSPKKDATSWSLRYAQVEGDKVISKQVDTVSTSVGGLSSSVQEVMESINGLESSYTVRIDSNGLVAGFGLYNDSNTSAFAVNADKFYVGNPTDAKKPFMVLTQPETVNGVTYPAGTWIDVALIANATIGSAHITDASITNAKIANLDAAKLTTGFLDTARIAANSIEAEKLTIGDVSNLWVNQYFDDTKARPQGDRSDWYPFTLALQGAGVKIWGNEHDTPWSTKLSMRKGNKMLVEFTARQLLDYSTALITIKVGFHIYGKDGLSGLNTITKVEAVRGDAITGGWSRYSALIEIPELTEDYPTTDGVLTFVLDQPDEAADPVAWVVGNLTVRKQMGGELLVNGTVTADKIYVADLSAISADLGTIKVGSANIADLAVNAAHIADAAITTAKIGDLQVDSLKIKDDAVSIGIGAQGVATITTISNGGKLRLDIGVQAYYSSTYIATTMGVRVLRNDAIIRTFSFPATYLGSEGLTRFSYTCALPPIMETIAAGTSVTYRLQITDYNGNWREAGSNGLWVGTSGLSMAITELKK